MLCEEIGWHLHSQALEFRFCGVRNSIAPTCQFSKKPFCFLTVGLIADFQITGLGNGVAFPDFVGTGGHILIFCRCSNDRGYRPCQFLSIFSCKMKFNYHMFSSRFSVICLSAVHMLTLFPTDSNCEMCRMFRLSFVRIRQMRSVLLLFCNRLDLVQFRYTADAVAWQLHQ